MAQNHYVDPKDQTIAAEGAPTRSELSTLYPAAVKEELGSWMSEDERQANMQKERDKVVRGLRQSSLLLGVYVSLPVILGLLLAKWGTGIALTRDNTMAYVFLMILILIGFIAIVYVLFKWVGKTFHDHTVRALPISLTTLLCLFFLIQPAFRLSERFIGGWEGYVSALGAVLLSGIIVTVVSVFTWTAIKLPAVFKIAILLVFFGASVAAAYLV